MGTPEHEEPPDALQALLRAWRALEPPPAGNDLAAESAETRAAVERLRAAWRAAEPPAADAARAAVDAWGARRRTRRLNARASAAAVLLVLGAAAWLGLRPGDAARSGGQVASAPGVPVPVPVPVPEPEPEPVPEPADGREPEPEPASPRRGAITDLTPDRIEMRSGNVRLVLLTQPTGSAPEPDSDH